VWGSSVDGVQFKILGGDDTARKALERWSLVDAGDRIA
jgi:hypothetical protein